MIDLAKIFDFLRLGTTLYVAGRAAGQHMSQTKHDHDRAAIEKSRKQFQQWSTEKLRKHLAKYEAGLYKHVRIAIKQLLAERDRAK